MESNVSDNNQETVLDELQLLKKRKYQQQHEDMTTTSLIVPRQLWEDFSVIVLKKYGFKGNTQTKARKSKSAIITGFLRNFVKENQAVLSSPVTMPS